MSAIGILGGMGPQASSRLVDLLIKKTPQFVVNPLDSDFPEIILLSVPVPNFVSDKNNILKAKEILIKKTKMLEIAGSTINCIACNTAHVMIEDLELVTDTPFLSMPLLVADRIKKSNFKRVGLFSTPNTLALKIYDSVMPNGVVLIKPSSLQIENLVKLIFKQIEGNINSSDKKEFRGFVESFIKDNNLDALILGCTELPVIFGECTKTNIIDCLDVLSDGVLEKFFSIGRLGIYK